MNIFATSKSPYQSAKSLDDKRLVKMVLETAQLLCTALNENLYTGTSVYHDFMRTQTLYKSTHKNHPCAKWARETRSNYRWLLAHFQGLINEYKHRYNKDHKCAALFGVFYVGIRIIPEGPQTPFPNCTTLKLIEPVELAYKLYMISKWESDEEKGRMPKWTNRGQPKWLLK